MAPPWSAARGDPSNIPATRSAAAAPPEYARGVRLVHAARHCARVLRRPIALVCALTAGCEPPPAPVGDAGPGATDVGATTDAARPDGAAGCTLAPGAVVTLPAPTDARLAEISGLVASRRDPGVLYVHNDSGEDAARFYALREDGSTLAEIVIDGLPRPRDWEDVAIETTTDGREVLTFGDVGDNAARDGSGTPRANVSVVRVVPPVLPSAPGAAPLHVAPLSVTTLVYADGPHDCEAILVEPETGDLYLITKENSGAAGLHRASAPLLDGETRTLEHVTDILPADALVTAADADARFVVVRNYGRAWVYERAGRSIAETLAGAGTRLPGVSEPQGEAIALAHDGSGVLFASEGVGEPMHFVPLGCAP